MQKYRADTVKHQGDGATVWSAKWMGGPTISKIVDCRLVGLAGDMRRTVYITGEPDTYFSMPAVTKLGGCRVKGYVGSVNGNLVFHHCYY